MAARKPKISQPVEPCHPSGLLLPGGPGAAKAPAPWGPGPAAGPSTPGSPAAPRSVSPSGPDGSGGSALPAGQDGRRADSASASAPACGPLSEVQANGLGLARDSAGLAFARLRALAECGDPKVELPAIKEILSWAWGKPAQSLNLEGNLGLADLARLLARASGESTGENTGENMGNNEDKTPALPTSPANGPLTAPVNAPANGSAAGSSMDVTASRETGPACDTETAVEPGAARPAPKPAARSRRKPHDA